MAEQPCKYEGNCEQKVGGLCDSEVAWEACAYGKGLAVPFPDPPQPDKDIEEQLAIRTIEAFLTRFPQNKRAEIAKQIYNALHTLGRERRGGEAIEKNAEEYKKCELCINSDKPEICAACKDYDKFQEKTLLGDDEIQNVLRNKRDAILSQPDAWASEREIASAQIIKLRLLGYRSPSEIRAIERDAVERVIRRVDYLIIGTTAPFEKRMTEGCIIFDMNLPQWEALKSELLGEQDKGG